MSIFNYRNKLFRLCFLAIIAAVLAMSLYPAQTTHALAPNTAQISFTFDDGRQTTYTNAAPVLTQYGLKGVVYVTTNCVGITTIPNTCHANSGVKYMTWNQVTSLQDTFGWEIGSHTISHPYLASFNAQDGQPLPLTPAQIENEISQSKAILANHGINAKSFASPYGDYNTSTLQTIAKYYSSHRGFFDQNNNTKPYNDLLLNTMQVQGNVSVAAVCDKIDDAIANKKWLILTFHGITPKASTKPDRYQWSTADLNSVAAYVKSKQDMGQIQTVSTSEGIVSGTVNLLPSPTTAPSGLSGGWTTDKPSSFSVDISGRGSFPEATRSIHVRGATSQAHLLSPLVPIDATLRYTLKSYLSVNTIGQNEIGYYIDEYDATGNWVSGQFKTRENSVYVESINFEYQPSSIRVKSARLQVYTTPGIELDAYIDEFRWYTTGDSTAVYTNSMPGGQFNQGFGQWRTNNTAAVKSDSNNNGSPRGKKYSLAFDLPPGTAHVFSPIVAVNSSSSYYCENYLMITSTISGEVGYYIDEYNSNGSWVSGQYKSTANSIGGRDIGFTYTPTSPNVSSISLQIIIRSDSGIRGYIDDSRVWQL